MRNFFLDLYEGLFGIGVARYQLIFDHALYYSNGYVHLGLIFILTPLLFTALFYFVYTYPYSKYWYWLIALAVCAVLVFAITYQHTLNLIFTNTHPELRAAISDPSTGYRNFASQLVMQLSIINVFLSIGLFAIYSLVFKQFSKSQGHLPI